MGKNKSIKNKVRERIDALFEGFSGYTHLERYLLALQECEGKILDVGSGLS
jgi:hypothetical protein